MLRFSLENKEYQRAGLTLLFLHFSIFIMALPPFRFSVLWGHTEMLVAVMYAFAAATAMWIAIGLMRRWLTGEAGYHPLWLCLVGSILWQLLATMAAPLPLLSWIGDLGTYEGSGRYAVFFLDVMMIYPLWQSQACRRRILVMAAATIVIQALLHVAFPQREDIQLAENSWAPFNWAAYLAFMAGYFWLAMMAGGYAKSRKSIMLLGAFTVILLILSHNKSSVLLLCAVLATIALKFVPGRAARRFFYPDRRWRIAAIVLCILPMAIVLAISGSVSLFSHPSLEKSSLYTVARERFALDQVALATLQHEPNRWLIGDGWGRYSDDLFKYALVDGAYVFHGGKRDPNWEAIDNPTQHCHNQPLETLLALGLPGMLLWYAVPLLFLWTMPMRFFWRCAPMIVAMTAMAHFWFELPQCVAYQAMSFAALYSICARGKNTARGKRWHGLLYITAAIAMACSAGTQLSTQVRIDRLFGYAALNPYNSGVNAWADEDIARGGERLGAQMTWYMHYVKEKSLQHHTDAAMAQWMTQFLAIAHRAATTPGIGARTASMEITLQDFILNDLDPVEFAEARKALAMREEAMMNITRLAPGREDMIEPFLHGLENYTGHDRPKQIAILEKILTIAPNHRAAMWKLGQLLLTVPGRQEEGKTLMAKALELQVGQVYPVN